MNACRTLCALSLLAWLTPAFAQDSSTKPANVPHGLGADIDLIRPMFTPDVIPGIDLPLTMRPGTVRGGLVLTYARNPLTLYQFEKEVGPIIQNRVGAYAGLSVDVTRALTVRAVLPFYFQYGSTIPRYAASGPALGDLDIGLHYSVVRRPHGGFGFMFDITAPTSRRNFYAGETLPRFLPGIMAMADAGIFRFSTNLGVQARIQSHVTTVDFKLGAELFWNTGFRFIIRKDQLTIGASAYTRFGFAHFLGAGETSVEAMLTAAYKATPYLWINVGIGRGFTKGYGTSDFRALVELRFQRNPKREGFEDEEYMPIADMTDQGGRAVFNVRVLDHGQGGNIQMPSTVPDDDDILGMDILVAGEQTEWGEGRIAYIPHDEEGDEHRLPEIQTLNEIQFVVGTSRLTPESEPILRDVADLINKHPEFEQIVIEGHASIDGPYDRNYALSVQRAQTVWQRLLELGVHPKRLSFVGLGEISYDEEDEQATAADKLQQARRVRFIVVRKVASDQIKPILPLKTRYPWNGEPFTPVQPATSAPESTQPQAARPPPSGRDPSLDDMDFRDDDTLPLDSNTPSDPPPSVDPPAEEAHP